MTAYTLFSGVTEALPIQPAGATADTGAQGATFASFTLAVTGPLGSYCEAGVRYSDDGTNWMPARTVKVSPTGPLSSTDAVDLPRAYRYFQGYPMSLSSGASATLTMTA